MRSTPLRTPCDVADVRDGGGEPEATDGRQATDHRQATDATT
ncbi:MAG TPA: hypothetical protein VIQ30_00905 [Pseudonocardia sp.]